MSSDNSGFWGRTCARLQQKNDQLQAQLKEAEEVIAFYGDEKNTHRFDPHFAYQSKFDLDSGKKAREYQKKWGKNE